MTKEKVWPPVAPWPKNLQFDAKTEKIITTRHAHEDKQSKGLGYNSPLWLIWTVRTYGDGVPMFPVLDTISDCEFSARYHLMMVVEESARAKQAGDTLDWYIERIPANHRFGSTAPELQMQTLQGFKNYWKTRKQLDGD